MNFNISLVPDSQLIEFDIPPILYRWIFIDLIITLIFLFHDRICSDS
jgi:hypothetical protein